MKKMLGMGNRASRRLTRPGGRSGSEDEDDGASRPTGERLNKIYKQLLEELAIPESKRDLMVANESDEKKWNLINAHRDMLKNNTSGDGSGAEEKRHADYWVDLISRRRSATNAPVITVEEAGELYAVMRTAHKQFLIDFIERDGVETLIDLTRWFTGRANREVAESKILPQIMSCYKALMNNNIGMEGVLAIPDSITSFALGMDLSDESDLNTAQEVVMLLAVTCFYSPEGREMVVKAMDDLRVRWREKQVFQTLVETFASTDDNEFRAAVIMFITTIVNSAAKVESRVRVRNDFLALDIMSVFERVMEEAKEEDDESFAVIATQYQVFEDMMTEDHKEVTFGLISGTSAQGDAEVDLSEQDQVFEYLYKGAQSAGCADLLLDVSQSLLLIPSERSLAVPTWQGVAQFIREATDYTRRSGATKGLRLNYQVLSELLDKRTELDERLAQVTSGDDIIGKQREKIKALERRVEEYKAGGGGKARSKSKASKADKAGKGEAGDRESTDEVDILKEQLEQLREEVTQLQKRLAAQHKGKPVEDVYDDDADAKDAASPGKGAGESGPLDSTGLQAAGPVPGVKSKGVPPPPLPNMPGSLELSPNPCKTGSVKPASKGKSRKAGKGAAAATAAAAGPPSGNALAGMLGARAAAMSAGRTPPGAPAGGGGPGPVAMPVKESEGAIRKRLGLPNKKAMHPTVKMKHIYWTPVAMDKLEGTVWPELSDQKIKFDVKRLERRFGQSKEAEKASKVALSNKRKSLGQMHLVTGTRQQNVGIALSKIRASDEEIFEAVWAMDETMLSLEHTQVLLTSAPTDDELELIKNFDESNGDAKRLAREDRFMRKMAGVPRLQARLRAVLTKHNFRESVTRIDDKVSMVRAAVAEVERSSKLQKLMEIVLAIGNYINGDTPRGSAWGYKLDALAQLDTIKDNSGKRTLMDFLYQVCEKHYPELCELELPNSKLGMGISLGDTMAELNQLASAVRGVKNELDNPPAHKRDRFAKAMSGFEVKASKRVGQLQTDFEKVRTDFQKLASRYAETGAAVEPETFFAKFVRFEVALQRAKRVVEEEREREERMRRLAEEKKRRQTLKKLKELEAAGADDGVFAKFAKANAGNADDIVQGFLQRNRHSTSAPAARPSRGGRSGGRGSVSSQSSKKSSKKKKKKVKIIKKIGPDGEIIIKRVKLKKKVKASPSVPNADFDIA